MKNSHSNQALSLNKVNPHYKIANQRLDSEFDDDYDLDTDEGFIHDRLNSFVEKKMLSSIINGTD